MTRSAWTRVAVLAIVVAAALAAASEVSAARAGKVCPPLTGRKWHSAYKGRAGTRYQWSVVGTGFTCANAKPWVAKLINDRAPSSDGGNVALHNGPRGYHCLATLSDRDGYAYIGVCFKGTFAFPGSGFQWAGS